MVLIQNYTKKSEVKFYEDIHVPGHANAQYTPYVILMHSLPRDPMKYFSKQKLCITYIRKKHWEQEKGVLAESSESYSGVTDSVSLRVRPVFFSTICRSDDSQPSVASWPCTL